MTETTVLPVQPAAIEGETVIQPTAPLPPAAPLFPAPAMSVPPERPFTPLPPSMLVPPAPPSMPVPPSGGPTADEIQAKQAKKLTDNERRAADNAAIASRKAEQEKFHADRIKLGQEANKAAAEMLWLGRRAIKIVRKAGPGDIDFHQSEACSVIAYVDTAEERVVQDKDIQTSPSGP